VAGVRSASVDFDDLFDPDITGDGPQAAGVLIGGVPARYAHIQYGSKRPDVGVTNAGVDVSNLWAAKGTATYRLPIHGTVYRYSNVIPPGQNGSCALTFSLGAGGTYRIIYNRTHGGNFPDVTGTWLPAGQSANNFEVRYTRTHIGGNANASVSSDASVFTTVVASLGIATSLGPNGSMSGTRTSLDRITIEIRNKTTGTINTTEIDFEVETDGSN
jgi:hypothetical protein